MYSDAFSGRLYVAGPLVVSLFSLHINRQQTLFTSSAVSTSTHRRKRHVRLAETMITISVEDYNQFSQDFYDSVVNGLQLHQLTCPCGHSACLKVHAYYERGIFLPDGIVILRICRVRCSECGHTHALMPSSIVPYCRISLIDQHSVIQGYENHSDRNAVCETNPSVDENNVKSIVRRYCRFWRERLRSEQISLSGISTLISGCFAHYSLQFMQIHRMANTLFAHTT